MRYLAIVLFNVLLMGGRAYAQDHHHPEEQVRRITVSGEGLVRVQPDMATVRFGVVTVADDPQEAQRLNTEAAARAMNSVRALGVEERNIRLETLRLQPHREWVDEKRRYEERGFEAIRQVVVQVDDLDKLPQLISGVVQEGANRLNVISYDLKERDAALDEALTEAINNARDKARLIARTLGEELGPVEQVNEQMYDFPRPVFRAELQDAAAKESLSEADAYAAGEIEVRVSVHTVFTIE
ncbi:MAG: SIMPL domain-containing protein [Rhodothermales bacterium]